jgi:exopolyphosphatase/pppGpp-phosphohydrolase
MTLSQIQKAIAAGSFTTTELNNLVQFVQGVKTRQAKQSIRVGDSVFVVQKTKRTPGIVEEIKIKKAIVSMRGMRYNVPLSMLESAA